MVFHVLAVLVVMELHADLIAALTPAVPVLTVWLMAAQLLLYACINFFTQFPVVI